MLSKGADCQAPTPVSRATRLMVRGISNLGRNILGKLRHNYARTRAIAY